MPKLPEYTSRGARAMVMIHDANLREFVAIWKRAKAAGVVLPTTDDPDYQSLDALLNHLMRAARGYMVWMCEQLQLPDPGIQAVPSDVAADPEAYMEHVLDLWTTPLAQVSDEAINRGAYRSRWGVEYVIDAMLEHAAMHPVRHSFQLRELMGDKHPAGR